MKFKGRSSLKMGLPTANGSVGCGSGGLNGCFFGLRPSATSRACRLEILAAGLQSAVVTPRPADSDFSSEAGRRANQCTATHRTVSEDTVRLRRDHNQLQSLHGRHWLSKLERQRWVGCCQSPGLLRRAAPSLNPSLNSFGKACPRNSVGPHSPNTLATSLNCRLALDRVYRLSVTGDACPIDDCTASGAAPFSISLVPKVWRSQWVEAL